MRFARGSEPRSQGEFGSDDLVHRSDVALDIVWRGLMQARMVLVAFGLSRISVGRPRLCC